MHLPKISTRSLALPLILAFICRPAAAEQMPGAAVPGFLADQRFQQARAFIKADHERFVRELVTLTEIPAPPFKEERARRGPISRC